MKHPNKPIQTYDDSRELHNQDHFNIWYNQKERKGLLVNDVMAGGKTHSIGCENGFIHLIDKFQPNLHWGVIDVPRVENTTDPVLLSGLYKLGQHLKRPVVIKTDYIRFREELSVKTLQNNNFLIILLNNTSYFCGGVYKKDDHIIKTIEIFNLQEQGFYLADEFHKGMNKNVDQTKENSGWYADETKMKFVRYKMFQKFLGITKFVIGYTATPLSTMKKDNEFYIIPKLDKSKRVVRTSVIDRINYYDPPFGLQSFNKTTGKWESSVKENYSTEVLQDFVTSIINKNTIINYIMKKYDLNISPIKTSGIIKINNLRNPIDVKRLEFMFNSIDVNVSFQWAVTTHEGIKLFEYDHIKKESTQIPHHYGDQKTSDQSLYNDMDDPNHPLRFLGVIEKGSLGINIKNLYGVLSFREPTTYDNDGIPVINNTVQFCGRPIRLKVKYEDLVNSLPNVNPKEIHEIWAEINSPIYFLPNDDFHRQVELELTTDYYNKSEVYEKLNEISGL